MILRGKRIFLRPFQLDDAPVLLKWSQNAYYHKMAGFSHFENLAQAKKAAQQYANRLNSYAICLHNSKQVIGLVELYERGLDRRVGLLKTKEIGFLLSQPFEDQGYMTEAVRLVLKDAFTRLRQTEIWAGTFSNNHHSQHLLKKLGFQYVYEVDYRKVSPLFHYHERYYLLRRLEWHRICSNAKS